MLELEDGVALSSKATARANCVTWLKANEKPRRVRCQEVGLRVNSVSSGLLPDDLEVHLGRLHSYNALNLSLDTQTNLRLSTRRVYGAEN